MGYTLRPLKKLLDSPFLWLNSYNSRIHKAPFRPCHIENHPRLWLSNTRRHHEILSKNWAHFCHSKNRNVPGSIWHQNLGEVPGNLSNHRDEFHNLFSRFHTNRCDLASPLGNRYPSILLEIRGIYRQYLDYSPRLMVYPYRVFRKEYLGCNKNYFLDGIRLKHHHQHQNP